MWKKSFARFPPTQSEIIVLIQALKTLGHEPLMQVCNARYIGIGALYGIELEPGSLFVGSLHANWDKAIDHYLEVQNIITTSKPFIRTEVKVDPAFIVLMPPHEMKEVLDHLQRARELILDISGAHLEHNTPTVLESKRKRQL